MSSRLITIAKVGVSFSCVFLFLLFTQCKNESSRDKKNTPNCTTNTNGAQAGYYPSPTPTLYSQYGTTAVPAYTNDLDRVFTTKCAICHSATATQQRATPYLTNYTEVSTNIAKVVTRLQNNTMPPANSMGGPLAAGDLQRIQQWQQNGMPQISQNTNAYNNMYGNNYATTTTNLNVNFIPGYDQEIRPILARYCVTCHQANGQAGRYDLSNVNSARQYAQLALQDINSRKMPPVGQPQLNGNEIELFRRWVNNNTPQTNNGQPQNCY